MVHEAFEAPAEPLNNFSWNLVRGMAMYGNTKSFGSASSVGDGTENEAPPASFL